MRVDMCGGEAERIFLPLRHYYRDLFDFEEDGVIATCYARRGIIEGSMTICAIGSRSTRKIFI